MPGPCSRWATIVKAMPWLQTPPRVLMLLRSESQTTYSRTLASRTSGPGTHWTFPVRAQSFSSGPQYCLVSPCSIKTNQNGYPQKDTNLLLLGHESGIALCKLRQTQQTCGLGPLSLVFLFFVFWGVGRGAGVGWGREFAVRLCSPLGKLVSIGRPSPPWA